MDSHGAPIHLRSPHSGVFREGQNPKNRLHTRHFVTRHPSPASPTPRSRTQLGHGHSQKYIRWSGAATLHAFTPHSFCIYAAFVVLSEEAEDRNEVTFCCFRVLENRELFCPGTRVAELITHAAPPHFLPFRAEIKFILNISRTRGFISIQFSQLARLPRWKWIP